MDGNTKFNAVAMLLAIVAVVFLFLGKWSYTFPTTIEGKVIQVQYSNIPPFPSTTISFETLSGDSATNVMLSGTAELNLKVGSTYSIVYFTPLGYLYAVPMSISLIS